jgi:hypothetical protein
MVYFLKIGRKGTTKGTPLLRSEEKIHGLAFFTPFLFPKSWGFLFLRFGIAGSLNRAMANPRKDQVDCHCAEILTPLCEAEGRTI